MRATIFLVLAAHAAGCGEGGKEPPAPSEHPPVRETIEKNKAGALKIAGKIGEPAKHKRVALREPEAAEGRALYWKSGHLGNDRDRYNTYVLGEEYLPDPGEGRRVDNSDTRDPWTPPSEPTNAVEPARKGTNFGEPPKDDEFWREYAGDCFRLLGQVRYVAVVRRIELAWPGPTSQADRFRPGHFRGEVRVFDLETGAYLGGFVLVAKNSSALTVAKFDAAKQQKKLVEDFRKQLENAFSEEMGKRFR